MVSKGHLSVDPSVICAAHHLESPVKSFRLQKRNEAKSRSERLWNHMLLVHNTFYTDPPHFVTPGFVAVFSSRPSHLSYNSLLNGPSNQDIKSWFFEKQNVSLKFIWTANLNVLAVRSEFRIQMWIYEDGLLPAAKIIYVCLETTGNGSWASGIYRIYCPLSICVIYAICAIYRHGHLY